MSEKQLENRVASLKDALGEAISYLVDAVIALRLAGDDKAADKIEKHVDRIKWRMWE